MAPEIQIHVCTLVCTYKECGQFLRTHPSPILVLEFMEECGKNLLGHILPNEILNTKASEIIINLPKLIKHEFHLILTDELQRHVRQ